MTRFPKTTSQTDSRCKVPEYDPKCGFPENAFDGLDEPFDPPANVNPVGSDMPPDEEIPF